MRLVYDQWTDISTTNLRVARHDFNIPSNMYFTYEFRCVADVP